MKKRSVLLPALLAILMFLSACVPVAGAGSPAVLSAVVAAQGGEAAPLTSEALPMPVASGTLQKKTSKAVIDYSNTADGYVMVQFTASSGKRLKAQVKGPSGTVYTYDIQQGVWVTLPLSDGNGSYKVTVFENTSGTKYSNVASQTMQVTLADEFVPFLRPNQYVNYENAPNTIAKAAELTAECKNTVEKVGAVYDFVVNGLTYDTKKAKTVQSGYLPVLDETLEAKTGICFDYAALMTAMLRSQGVPCKLVVGYADTAYHAWVSVWSAETGWVDGAVYFDGKSWQRMDPTFMSSGQGSESIRKFVGDGSNYIQKYLY